MRYVLTAQQDALPLALHEAGGARVLRLLAPGVALCELSEKPAAAPIFLRHICPADQEIKLTGGMDDIPRLVKAVTALQLPESSMPFSIQTRILEGYQPDYKPFDVNTRLADAVVAQTGALVDVKSPVWVVSVTLDAEKGYIGWSPAKDNLSDWAGGARRFKKEPDQISRAEFKLLEALETFRVPLPTAGHAQDLGAAPGGWTRVLRQRGLTVTAVDPAALDPRVLRDSGVKHLPITAQEYFRSPSPCDLMVNDMKMDTDPSARLMAEGAHCLHAGGHAILTLKLPEKQAEWLPRIHHAEAILKGAYRVEGIRQLFHNRSEVTCCLTLR